MDLYNAICQHGSEEKTELKHKMIIDYGCNFVFTPDLADSVAPWGWLSNSVCEIALHVLSREMAPHKKYIMPLNISVSVANYAYEFLFCALHSELTSFCAQNKLRVRSFTSKEIKKVFAFSDANRLDHKEQVLTTKDQ